MVLRQVWFPLDPRPGVRLFVQAERPRGEHRRADVAPPHAVPLPPPSPPPSLLSPSASFSCVPSLHPPERNKVQRGPLNCLRMFCVYVLFMRDPRLGFPPGLLRTSQKSEPCDGSVAPARSVLISSPACKRACRGRPYRCTLAGAGPPRRRTLTLLLVALAANKKAFPLL